MTARTATSDRTVKKLTGALAGASEEIEALKQSLASEPGKGSTFSFTLSEKTQS